MNEKLIATFAGVVLATLLGLLGWLSVFVWDSNNRLQSLIAHQGLLLTPGGEIRASNQVLVLESRVDNLDRLLEHIRVKQLRLGCGD